MVVNCSGSVWLMATGRTVWWKSMCAGSDGASWDTGRCCMSWDGERSCWNVISPSCEWVCAIWLAPRVWIMGGWWAGKDGIWGVNRWLAHVDVIVLECVIIPLWCCSDPSWLIGDVITDDISWCDAEFGPWVACDPGADPWMTCNVEIGPCMAWDVLVGPRVACDGPICLWVVCRPAGTCCGEATTDIGNVPPGGGVTLMGTLVTLLEL